MIRTYSELMGFDTFTERFKYLSVDGSVGFDTFGHDRFINQGFYKSREWRQVRDHVIVRDNGCDLGIEGYDIPVRIVIHHMNPLTIKDFINVSEYLINPEYLICTTHETHNAIHYGDENLLVSMPIERRMHDTSPWRN